MKMKESFDFLKTIKGIEMDNEKKKLKESIKKIREFYLELIEAGFSSQEAMAFIAIMKKGNTDNEND
jgi:hypothetical protein